MSESFESEDTLQADETSQSSASLASTSFADDHTSGSCRGLFITQHQFLSKTFEVENEADAMLSRVVNEVAKEEDILRLNTTQKNSRSWKVGQSIHPTRRSGFTDSRLSDKNSPRSLVREFPSNSQPSPEKDVHHRDWEGSDRGMGGSVGRGMGRGVGRGRGRGRRQLEEEAQSSARPLNNFEKRVIQQVTYYFSNTNLPSDDFLVNEIRKDVHGCILSLLTML